MNVKELKKLLENVSDNTLVVIEGRDHSYLRAYARSDFAVREGDDLAMFYNQEHEIKSKIPVLYFSA